MKLSLLNRRIHYWLTLLVAIPLLVVVSTGILLQLKKQFAWIQPTEKKGTAKTPSLSFDEMLRSVRSGSEELAGVEWKDIKRIDVRPSKGVAKLTIELPNSSKALWDRGDWEVQLDTATGEVLQFAYRRSDWIESLHDGSFLAGDWSKLGLFLPAALGLLGMLLSGVWLFWQPIQAKRRKRRT
jgi:uncharacterized iron-regulated membrane protein